MNRCFRTTVTLVGCTIIFGGYVPVRGAPGELIWQRTIAEPNGGASGISADTAGNLYVASGIPSRLYSLSPSGATNWTHDFAGGAVAPPALAAGRVYLPAYSGQLHALDESGQFQWGYTNQSHYIHYPPAIGVDGTIYLAARRKEFPANDLLTCFNPNGSIRWNLEHGEGRPMISAAGLLVTATRFGDVLGVRPDGSIAWQASSGEAGEGALGVSDHLFFGAANQSLFSYNSVGQQQWAFDLPAGGFAPQGIALDQSGRAFFQDGAGKFVCLDATGSLAWDYSLPVGGSTGPAVASDGTVYVCSQSGELIALSSAGGFLWSFATGEPCYSSPLLLPNGNVAFTTGEGKVYLLEGTGAGLAASPWPMVGGGIGRRGSLQTSLDSPGAPTNLAASIDTFVHKVEISWESAHSAQTYSVYRSDSSNAAAAVILASDIGGKVSFADHGGIPGQTYFYWVQGVNSAGVSTLAGPVEGRRGIPQIGDIAHRLPYSVVAPPVISLDGSITFVCADGKVRSVTPSGQLRWEFTVFTGNVAFFAGHPVVGDEGNLLVTVNFRDGPSGEANQGVLIVLSPAGSEVWRKELNQIIFPPAVAPDGGIVVALQEDWLNPVEGTGGVYMYAQSGALKWFYPVGGGVMMTPVIQSDGTVFFGGRDRLLRALTATGKLRWSFDVGSPFGAPIYPGPDGSTYVLANELIRKFSLSGNVEWAAPSSDVVTGNALVDSAGNLLAEANSIPRKLYSYNPQGVRNWTSAFGNEHLALAEADELLILNVNTLHRINTSGLEIGSYQFQDAVYRRFLLATDGVAWLATGAELLGLKTASGPQTGMWPSFAGNLQNQNRFSAVLQPPISAPVLTATSDTFATHVQLQWNDVAGAQAFELWRSTTAVREQGAQLVAGLAGTLNHQDRSAVQGTTYYYWIRAVNSTGVGPWSSATTGSRRQPTPGEILDVYPFAFAGQQWDAISAPAVAMDGTIFTGAARTNVIPSRDPHHFFAALTTVGTVQWERSTLFPVTTIPAILPNGNVAFVNETTRVMDPTGNLVWEAPLAGFTPAVANNGELIMLSFDQVLTRLDSNGGLVWRHPTGDDRYSGVNYKKTPVIGADGAIHVATSFGTLLAVEPDGRRRWQRSLIPAQRSVPVPGSDGVIYLGGPERMYAINADGNLWWQTDLPGAGDCHSPALDAAGNLYFVTLAGLCVSLNPNGVIRWSVPTGSQCYSETAVAADGSVLFGSEDGHIYALDAADGTLLWKTPLGSPVRTSPVLADSGMMHVRALDGDVYSLWVGAPPAASHWPMFRGNQLRQARSTAPMTVPAAPTITAITKGTDHRHVMLRWYSVRGATHYEVWRSSLGSDFATAALISDRVTATTNFIDAAVTAGVTYHYWLVAKNTAFRSAASNHQTGWIRIPMPGDVLSEIHLADGQFHRHLLSTAGDQLIVAGRFDLRAYDLALRQLWELPTPSANYSAATSLSDGRILYATNRVNGTDVVFVNSDGSTAGSRSLSLRLEGSPAVRVDNGTVWVASVHLEWRADQALSLTANGAILWQRQLGSQLLPQPALGTDGTAFFADTRGTLYALSEQGELVWSNRLQNVSVVSQFATALGVDGGVYFPLSVQVGGSFPGRLVVADHKTGAIRETLTFDQSVYGTPLISSEGQTLIGHYDGTIQLFAQDNTLIWSNRVSAYPHPVRTSDGSYVIGTSQGLDFVSGADGQVQWSYRPELPAEFGQPLISAAGMIYVMDSRGYLRKFFGWQPASSIGWNYPDGDHSRHQRAKSLVYLARVETNSPLVAAEPYALRSSVRHEGGIAAIEWRLPDHTTLHTTNLEAVVELPLPAPGLNRWRLSFLPNDGPPVLSPSFDFVVAGPRLIPYLAPGPGLGLRFYAHSNFNYQPLVTTNFGTWSASVAPVAGTNGWMTIDFPALGSPSRRFYELWVTPETMPE
jgi:outer membrane protein assembly factor BamB